MCTQENIERIQRDIDSMLAIANELDPKEDKAVINYIVSDIELSLSLLDDQNLRNELDKESFIKLENYVDNITIDIWELTAKTLEVGP